MLTFKYTPKNQPYLAESTVASTLPGTDYQINVLILYAFSSIKKGKAFELRTESSGFGKFDDIHLYHEDNFEVVQIKHSQVNDLKLNSLAATAKVTKNTARAQGDTKFDLWMYFDSWFNYKDCTFPVEFVLYTNMHFSEEHRLDKCVSNGRFIPELYTYDEDKRKLEREISGNIRAYTESKKKSLKENINYNGAKIFQRMRENAQTLKDQDFELQTKLISQFLQAITFKHSQKNVDDLTESVKELFRKEYNTTNDAIYYYIYYQFKEWLKKPNPISHTHESINGIFVEANNKFIKLGRYINSTFEILDNIKKSYPKNIVYRESEISLINEFISNSKSKLLTLHGISGIGKTSIIEQFISNRERYNQPFRYGEFIFISSDMLADDILPILFDPAIQLIVLDNAEVIIGDKIKNEILMRLFNHIKEIKNKRLILVTNNEPSIYQNIILNSFKDIETTTVSVAPLTEEQVNKVFQDYAKYREVTHLAKLLTIPFYLRLMVEKAPWAKFSPELSEFVLKRSLINMTIGCDNTKYSNERNILVEKFVYQQLQACKKHPGIRSTHNILISFSPRSEKEQQTFQSLIDDSIITEKDKLFYFQHTIYMEWAIHEYFEREFTYLKIQENLERFSSSIRLYGERFLFDWLEHKFVEIFELVNFLLKNTNYSNQNSVSFLIHVLILTTIYQDKTKEFDALTNLPEFTDLNKKFNHERARYYHQYTYLLLSINTQSTEILRYLVARNASIIHVDNDSLNLTNAWYMMKNIGIGIQYDYPTRNEYYYLHTAAQIGNENSFQILLTALKKGNININFTNQYSESALHIAVKFKQISIIKLLLANNANVNLVDIFGESPLSCADNDKGSEVSSLFLVYKEDPNCIINNTPTSQINTSPEVLTQFSSHFMQSTQQLNNKNNRHRFLTSVGLKPKQ